MAQVAWREADMLPSLQPEIVESKKEKDGFSPQSENRVCLFPRGLCNAIAQMWQFA